MKIPGATGFKRVPVLILLVISVILGFTTTVPAGQVFAPVIVTDATGKSIRFTRFPRRIVVIGVAPFVPLHILYMFPEMKNILVGYEQKTRNMGSFIELIDPGCKGKSAMMSNPGIEQIVSLNPDLVVAKGTVPGTLDKPLAQIGIPTLCLNTETPEKFLNDIAVIGKVLGNETRAREISAFYNRRLNLIKEGLKGITPEQKPRVLVIEYSNRGGGTAVRVPAASWIQTIQVQKAGGRPVWTDHVKMQHGWQIVGFEQIAVWNPDKIFMVVWHTLDDRRIMHSLESDGKWRMLKAVNSNNFFLIPHDMLSWDTPDPRWILGMLWMAGKIHPERFSQIDITEEVYLFFEQLYAMDKAAVDRHILPELTLNAGS